jgi:hypothetical protein
VGCICEKIIDVSRSIDDTNDFGDVVAAHTKKDNVWRYGYRSEPRPDFIPRSASMRALFKQATRFSDPANKIPR